MSSLHSFAAGILLCHLLLASISWQADFNVVVGGQAGTNGTNEIIVFDPSYVVSHLTWILTFASVVNLQGQLNLSSLCLVIASFSR